MKNYVRVNYAEQRRIRKVLEWYDVSTFTGAVYRNTIANNNQIYLAASAGTKYILRESNPSKSLPHLKLEAKLLDYLQTKHFTPTPRVIRNLKGESLTKVSGRHYILEIFLPGSVTKEVNDLVRFNDRKLVNLFISLAEFSKVVRNFRYMSPKDNLPLSHYVKNGEEIFSEYVRRVRDKKIQGLLQKDHDFINDFIHMTKQQTQTVDYDRLPKQIVHFDLHPGNVNFMGDHVTGIFDFDWVRFDTRFTDLACTIGQSCYVYLGRHRARYNAHKIQLALRAYRRAYGKSEFSGTEEKRILCAGLRGYMLYQLFWTIEWYLKNPRDTRGYRYLEFSLDVLRLNDFDSLIE